MTFCYLQVTNSGWYICNAEPVTTNYNQNELTWS